MSSEHPTEDEEWEGHDPLDGEPPPEAGRRRVRRSRRSSSRAGSSSSRSRCCVVALYLVAKAAGVVLLAFTVAAVVALILNPMVAFLQRRRLPRGAGDPGRLPRAARVAGRRSASCWPTRSPTRRRSSARTSRAIVDDANSRLADLQAYFDRKGINVEVKRQGETALQTLQEKVVGGTSDIVNFGGEILQDGRHRRARACCS